MNENRKLTPSLVLIHILLIVLVVINLFPLYWMMTFSLKDKESSKYLHKRVCPPRTE